MYKEKIKNLIEQMTLDEKIGIIHGDGLFKNKGVERLGIPPLKMADGPMGVRAEFKNDCWENIGYSDDYVTYLPCGSAIASTWNRELSYDFGNVLGCETRGRGKDMILAPSMNIIRSPLCGRNFEYLSEDTYHTGEIAKNIVKGIQANDVASCIKHFACNNQETERLNVDTIVDDETLHDVYLKAFKKCIDESDALGIMGAYNQINGEQCCESNYLLNEVLREQWGYEHLVVSDWSGVKTTLGAVKTGLDIEMGVTYNFDEYYMANPLKELIEKGEVSEKLLDKKVANILNTMFKLKMIENKGNRKSGLYNSPKHREIAKKIAEESMVLLKNEGLLPLDKNKVKKLLIIGDNAEKIHSNGGGSAEIKALYEISPLMGLKSNLGGNCEVTYVRGYISKDKKQDSKINWQEASLEKQERENEQLDKLKNKELFNEAISLAKEHDYVIFIGGLNHKYDVEGLDREEFNLPYDQDELIEELLKVNQNTIINIVAGSAVNLSSIANKSKALIWSWYSGIEGGNALYDILFGNVNPSGRLNQSFCKTIEDYSSHSIGTFGNKDIVEYKEKDKVGYRHLINKKLKPVYPYGYGLSYTTFEYSNFNVSGLEISINIKNIGEVSGSDVIQVYTIVDEVKKLVGFTKVYIEKSKEKKVSIILKEEDFYRYCRVDKSYKLLENDFEIIISKNSLEDIFKTKIKLK